MISVKPSVIDLEGLSENVAVLCKSVIYLYKIYDGLENIDKRKKVILAEAIKFVIVE